MLEQGIMPHYKVRSYGTGYCATVQAEVRVEEGIMVHYKVRSWLSRASCPSAR